MMSKIVRKLVLWDVCKIYFFRMNLISSVAKTLLNI